MSLCWIARIIYVGNSLLYLVTVSWAIVLVLLSTLKYKYALLTWRLSSLRVNSVEPRYATEVRGIWLFCFLIFTTRVQTSAKIMMNLISFFSLSYMIEPVDYCSVGHLAKYWGGQAYCFEKMTSHISVVLEQKTIVFQNIGGHCPPPLAPLPSPLKCPPLDYFEHCHIQMFQCCNELPINSFIKIFSNYFAMVTKCKKVFKEFNSNFIFR